MVVFICCGCLCGGVLTTRCSNARYWREIRPKQRHRDQGHDLHAGAGADRADAAGHGQHPNEYRTDRRVVCMFLGVDSLAVNLSISISVSISVSISIGFMLCREGQQRQAGGARGDGRGGRHRYVPCIYMIHTHAHAHARNQPHEPTVHFPYTHIPLRPEAPRGLGHDARGHRRLHGRRRALRCAGPFPFGG